IPRAVVSRDLSMVFFYFPASPSEPPGYAVIKTDGTGYRELSLVENGQRMRFTPFPACVSWSWDNRYLLTCSGSGTRFRLLKVSVSDGSVLDVLPGRGDRVGRAHFSPDGRFIAYSEGFGPGPIYIVPSDGEPRVVAQEAGLVDWTRDGRYLILGQVRSGKLGF